MNNLKELTWEHHKNAERQDFVKVLMSGKISEEQYGQYLFNQHKMYDVLEVCSAAHGLIPDSSIDRARRIQQDYEELFPEGDNRHTMLPSTVEYLEHIKSILNDPKKLLAHLYVRHMGDLSGGQMIAKRIPGSGKFYQFDKPVDELKDKIRESLSDDLADEAKICFDFATQLFQEMSS
jgi:heme oxygenase|tara:strand:+ start:9228 stop:9761 length:534 start_codon:yes stop_codon:yes gene_type:complete